MRIVSISAGPALGHGPPEARKDVYGKPFAAQYTFIGTGLWCVDGDGLLYAQVQRAWSGDTKTLSWYPVASKVVNE